MCQPTEEKNELPYSRNVKSKLLVGLEAVSKEEEEERVELHVNKMIEIRTGMKERRKVNYEEEPTEMAGGVVSEAQSIGRSG